MGRRPVRLLIGVLAAFGAVWLGQASASGCASLAGVHSFRGHAYISFDGSASGPIEGSGGNETISLHRSGASLQLKLTHKTVGKGEFHAIVFYSGKARLGTVTVQDSLELSGGGYGSETYSGSALPSLGSATVALDTDDCRYALSAGFGANTTYSGDGALQPGATVSVSVVGDRDKIPKNLQLIGGVGPDAYLSCPGEPLLSGRPCIEFAGGWANDFAELKLCGSFPPEGDCASRDEPVGGGKFIWVLKPH